jgi:hypothetical protein
LSQGVVVLTEVMHLCTEEAFTGSTALMIRNATVIRLKKFTILAVCPP